MESSTLLDRVHEPEDIVATLLRERDTSGAQVLWQEGVRAEAFEAALRNLPPAKRYRIVLRDPRWRAVVLTAADVARALGDRWVRPDHYLVAILLTDERSRTGLRDLGFDPDRLRALVLQSLRAT